MASDRGIAEACVNLGEIYRIGMGIKAPDFERAKYWHKKAASLGSQASMDILADESNFTFRTTSSSETSTDEASVPGKNAEEKKQILKTAMKTPFEK
jgi:TPR repeat protein